MIDSRRATHSLLSCPFQYLRTSLSQVDTALTKMDSTTDEKIVIIKTKLKGSANFPQWEKEAKASLMAHDLLVAVQQDDDYYVPAAVRALAVGVPQGQNPDPLQLLAAFRAYAQQVTTTAGTTEEDKEKAHKLSSALVSKHRKAFQLLYTSVDSHAISDALQHNTAFDLWKDFGTRFRKTTASRQAALYTILINLRQGRASLESHLDTFRRAVYDLLSAGYNPLHLDKKTLLLSSLSEEYETVTETLLATNPTITY